MLVDPNDVRACRHELGLTQKQLARLLGYKHYNRISAIENGKENISKAAVRLINAYLEGYRPPDWPETTRTPHSWFD